MDQNNPNPDYMQNDEIDLAELARVLWSSKKLIASITATVTLFAALYVFNKTPIYEASSLVEIGSYKLHNNNNNNNNNNKASLDSSEDLSRILNILFIDMAMNEKGRDFEITSISVPAKVNNFIEIKSEAHSNEIASRAILKVVSYIKKNHQNKLDNVLSDRRSRVKSIDQQISTIKNKQLELLSIDENLNGESALLNSIQLISMINGELGVESVSRLINERNELTLLLNDQNYKNSEIVGQVITSDYPTKPNKKLIVTVAFIAGFILSIFLVFIMNAFRPEYEKSTS